MVIRNYFRFQGLKNSVGYVNELLGDQDRFPHDGHYRFVRGLDKRHYNDLEQNRRPRFGKRKMRVINSPLSIFQIISIFLKMAAIMRKFLARKKFLVIRSYHHLCGVGENPRVMRWMTLDKEPLTKKRF